ncbi:uncharacterized protein VTP21DRAFT_3306 [Calcarisporiella thermophila]|uniref:uncharacterized protein n=1 Tax=Calcarisporiella thermophila TaxID=911321 RepID=UPI0037438FBC
MTRNNGKVHDEEQLIQFCKRLPKVELHAHLTGSLSPSTFQTLVNKHRANIPELEGFTLPEGKVKIAEFFDLFRIVNRLTADEESLRFAAQQVVQDFAADGVRYLELRTTPKISANMTKEDYVRTVLSAIRTAPPNILVRLILSVDRRETLEQAQETVDIALKYKDEGVVGLDLCGHVEKGHFDIVKPAFVRAREGGLRLTVHFGEIPENLNEAESLLSVSPHRLGHATHVDPASQQIIRSQNIPIEICMSSNVLSHTVASFEDHHVKDHLREGHAVVLCTDDKGVFLSELSNEYAIAARTFGMTEMQLFELSRRGIACIFEEEEVKEQLREEWDRWWKEYICKTTLN